MGPRLSQHNSQMAHTALDGQGLPHALVHGAPGPSSGSPRRRVHEGGSSKRAYRTRNPSLVQGPRGICCVALGPPTIYAWPSARATKRGRPERCQLRGGAGLRCQKNAVAPSNASSRVTEPTYGKYWRRELPGLKPVRQWKFGRVRARCWRRELPGLEPIRQRKMRSKVWPRRRERSASHHSPSPGAALR